MPAHLDEAVFRANVLEASKPVIVVFYAQMFPESRVLAEAIRDLDGADRSDLPVVLIQIEANLVLRIQYEINPMPTVIVFNEGHPIARLESPANVDAVCDWLKGKDLANIIT